MEILKGGGMNYFPNKAGNHADTDDILNEELRAAGIANMLEAENLQNSEAFKDMLLRQSGEVKTTVKGVLHGWTFTRAWYYWIAKGPGIEFISAQALQKTYGKVVRAYGDCACRGPLHWFKGLACGYYHVDTPEGLKALTDTIKEIVERAKARSPD